MNKAVFLDRDGTINVDYGYVYRPQDFHFIDGVIDGLSILQDLGYLLIVITNQSGVGRGYYSEKEMKRCLQYMEDQLALYDILIQKTYYCPHYKQNCLCRKPKTKLFEEAIDDFNIDCTQSYAIGDKLRDLSICEKKPVTGILLTEDSKIHSSYVKKKNLLEAARYIQASHS